MREQNEFLNLNYPANILKGSDLNLKGGTSWTQLLTPMKQRMGAAPRSGGNSSELDLRALTLPLTHRSHL